MLLVAAGLMGIGSSIFHPESSRVARMASGGRHGLAQSLFQVGGNVGSSLGPLLAAFIVVPRGQSSIAWFSLLALAAIVLLVASRRLVHGATGRRRRRRPAGAAPTSAGAVARSASAGRSPILVALIFSKYFYLASLTSYYTFYLISKFHVSVQSAQLHLFVFLGAVAAGTILGGPIGDRIGRKYVIWGSILGVLPFTLLLPYANLFWTGDPQRPDRPDPGLGVLGHPGLRAGTGARPCRHDRRPLLRLAFGMGGLGAAVLGKLADRTSIEFVYRSARSFRLIGLLAAFLPSQPRE